MHRRVDPLLAVLVPAIVVLPVLFGLFGNADRGATTATFWVVFALLHATYVVVTSRLATLHRDADPFTRGARRLWRCAAAAGALLTVGDLYQLWAVSQDPLARNSYLGTPVQLGTVLAAVILFIVGLLRYPSGGGTGGGTARLRLDVATVMAGATTCGLLLITPPAGEPSVRWTLLFGALLLAQPGLFLVAVFAVVKLFLGGRSPFTRAAGILNGLAAAVQTVAQSVPEPVYLANGRFGWLIGGNLLGSMLLLAAARVQERQVRQDPARVVRQTGDPYSMLPYGAMVVTWALTVGVLAGTGLNWRSSLVGLGAMVTTALVVTRQAAAFRHIGELLRERDELTARLTEQAYHDALTGLANRALFMRTLTESLNRTPVTVFLVDLDDFKPVNDSYGHAVGDQLLIEVGRRLRGCVRAGDLVARLGGDEFAMLVHDLEPDRAAELSGTLRAALHGRVDLSGVEVRMRASVGHASGRPDTHGPDSLLHEADMAMYAVKNTARAVRR